VAAPAPPSVQEPPGVRFELATPKGEEGPIVGYAGHVPGRRAS